MGFADEVYELVRRCPRGRVVSYGGVAAMLGKPRLSRAVGAAMRELPEGSNVSWWRVISSSGRISIPAIEGGKALQRVLLEKEGVKFSEAGRISWERYGWDGE